MANKIEGKISSKTKIPGNFNEGGEIIDKSPMHLLQCRSARIFTWHLLCASTQSISKNYVSEKVFYELIT